MSAWVIDSIQNLINIADGKGSFKDFETEEKRVLEKIQNKLISIQNYYCLCNKIKNYFS
ncbi:hypothetical protein [Francisella philomiragia]|uniref:Uncharacterized protein n=1 Tax=Francisella philomiragia TaxID=28110 RepID=A0A0B6D0V7_9GAMM|nr:hypothetical protein [Francisella philomiragia]AJI52471.1 hypothetical protein LA55_1533 [Francisella philomiragia]